MTLLTLLKAPVLAVPTGLALTPLAGGFDVSWDNMSATSYTLDRSPDGSTGWATVYSGSGSTFNNVGLSGLTTYYYRVSATYSGGTSDWSSNVSGTTLSTASPRIRNARRINPALLRSYTR